MNPVIHSLLPTAAMALLLVGGLVPANNQWLSPLGTAVLLECVAFLLPMAVFGLLNRKMGTPLRLRLRPARLRFLPLTLFVAVAVSLLSFFLNYLTALATGGTLLAGTAYDALARFGGAPGWLLVLALAVLPALVEEVFFRGALLSGLERWGQGAAILISALCFAMLHGNAANFLGPLAAGLLFGYLTVVTGSVWPAVVGHLCNNLIYLWMGYVLKRYAAFGIWPYFLILTVALLFVFTYLAAATLERLVGKGRIPRLKGAGGAKALIRGLMCPGVLATAALFIVKITLL